MATRTLDYSLYLVTDRDLMSTATLAEALEAACAGGVTLVQLREKHASFEEFVAIAREAKAICDRFDVPLIINDEPEVCAAVDAAGVHVGQDDHSVAEVRAIIGPDKIVGVSASTLAEALTAEADGADYLGIGAMAYTATKPDAHVTSRDELEQILAQVSIPSVVIGGINEQSIPTYAGLPLAGYAIVSAIIAAPDIEQATREIAALVRHNAEG